jgi:hypothetical protein
MPRGSNDAKGLDLIVIGAQKAGTTSLFEHLRQHPELYLPPGKERPFFSDDEAYAAGWPSFAADTFADAPEAALWGKATPSYMLGCPVRADGKTPGEQRFESTERIIPERIRELFPDVKLVAILRDPVERCVSNYRMHAMGRPSLPPLDRRIAELLRPDALENSRRLGTAGFVTRGEYGRILEGYYAVFPRDQIFVCFTRDLEQTPHELMCKLFALVGVDPAFVPQSLATRHRAGATSPRIGWLRSPSELQKKLVCQPGVRSLWRLLPIGAQRRVILALREANYRFELWNGRGRKSERFDVSPETLARLRVHYEEDGVLLEQLIGKPVPWGS